MLSNKHINKIIYVVTAVCLTLALVLVVIAVGSDISFASGKAAYTELVFDRSKVIDIDILVGEQEWQDMLDNAMAEKYISVDISINGEILRSVGIRPKGNSSLSLVSNMPDSDRYSFKVKFDEYIEGQNLHGLNKLALNNVISDSTYMKEYLSYGLFELMEVPTPNFAYASIKVNGKDWGFYIALETLEESYVERVFGSLEGNLYKPEGGGMSNNVQGGFQQIMEDPEGQGAQQGFQPKEQNIPQNNEAHDTESANDHGNRQRFLGGMNGFRGGANLVWVDDNESSYSSILENVVLSKTTSSDHKKVLDMIKNLNEGTNLEKYIDIDEALRYFAVETFLVNLDSYEGSMKHNYYLYEENGVFKILPWDYNLSFGAFQLGDASKAINFPIDAPVTDTMENSPLVSKLLEVPEHKEIYHSYLQKIVDEYVNNGLAEKTIYETDRLINSYVKNDVSAFFTYEQYTAALPILTAYCEDRAKSIQAQLDGLQPSETYGNIPTMVDLNALGSQGGGALQFRFNNGDGSEEFAFNGNIPIQNGNINFEMLPKIMEILQDSTEETITEEQKEKLRGLGLSDEDISEVYALQKTITNDMGRAGANRNQMPNGNRIQGNMPNMQSRNNNTGSVVENYKISDYYTEMISAGILLFGIIFALIFKRRRV